MKKITFLITFLFGLLPLCLTSHARKAEAATFEVNPLDLYAQSIDTQRKDVNGELCALLIVESRIPNLKFGGGTVVGDVVNKNNDEYWVYLVTGTKKIQVNGDGIDKTELVFATLDNEISHLKGGMTYKLKLVRDRERADIILKNIPQKARLIINDKVQKKISKDGTLIVSVPYGELPYSLEMKGFEKLEGTFDVQKDQENIFEFPDLVPEKKVNVKDLVNLTVETKEGAEIFIDGKLVGVSPYTGEFSPGDYVVGVEARGYKPETKKITLPKNTDMILLIPYLKEESAANNTPEPDPTPGKINGYDYVDLGLPSGTKWATCNVGASSPSESGSYFAWGEIQSKEVYNEGNCWSFGHEINDIVGNPKYDAATANWGGTWRMPTHNDIKELKNKCEWVWTMKGSTPGYEVTGPNGKKIFLPAVGYRIDSKINIEPIGQYWSGMNNPKNPDQECAGGLFIDSEDVMGPIINFLRFTGMTIRPVSD